MSAAIPAAFPPHADERRVTPSANPPYKAASISSVERLSFRGRAKRGTWNPVLAESASGFRVRCFQLTAFAVGAGRPGMTSKAKWSAFDARSQPIACAAPPPVLRTTSPALAGEEYSECAARSFFPRQGGGSGREAVEGGERRINTPMKRCSPWLNSRTLCGNSGIVILQR